MGYQGVNRVLVTFATERFRFHRRLTLDGPRLQLAYELENRTATPMPWLWSQHCLLQTAPGDLITLAGLGNCIPTHLTHPELHQGQRGSMAGFNWPDIPGVPFDLNVVQAADAQFALKAYAPVHTSFSATIGDSQSQLYMAFDASDIPFVGLWISYGGWPDAWGVHQLAIEPTSAPADDLVSALEAGHAELLQARSTRHWSVSMTVSSAFSAFSAESAKQVEAQQKA